MFIAAPEVAILYVNIKNKLDMRCKYIQGQFFNQLLHANEEKAISMNQQKERKKKFTYENCIKFIMQRFIF